MSSILIKTGDPHNPCCTLVPWTNNVPDFTGITEPTLSVLRAAYEASKGNIVIIPDTEAETVSLEPMPDWDGFKNHLDNNGIYQQMLEVDFSLATNAFQAISFILGGIEIEDNIRQINLFYQVFAQQSSPELMKALSGAVARFNIPIQLG
jgi:hypothetical protein